MKVSTLLLVTLASSIAAYPGILDVLGANEANVVDTLIPGSQGLDSIAHSVRSNHIPNLSGNEYVSQGHEASRGKDGNGLINLDLVSPFQSMLGKDNLFISAISKTVDAAGDVVKNIAGNIEKGTGLPLLSIGETIKGVIRGLDKSDSGLSKGHESGDNDDSRASIGVKGTGTDAWKEGHTGAYRESAEDGAKEVSSEKRGIHSTGSQGSSRDAKTGDGEEKRPGQWISTESKEKSAEAKERSHSSEDMGKKSLSNENGESWTNVDRQEAVSQVENAQTENGSESAKEVDRKSAEA